MNAEENREMKLPDGWILCSSKSNPGRMYYFNKKTGKSLWTKPQADEISDHTNRQKAKKTKCSHSDKYMKIESPKKTTKRKNECKEDSPLQKKKNKEATSTPKKIEKPSNISRHSRTDTSRNDTCQSAVKGPKQLSKNIASARLSQLQSQLAAEVQKEDTFTTDKSPSKARISPITQPETQAKIQRTELMSPNLNESKCSTSQSPGSDSLQSIPSPSQFLTANKIISSMKAQIPEKYCDNIKPSNTFADIEEGINKQTAEYSFMKHPATPPQFSEANKLVSAIKSKLSYKGSASKDLIVKTFTSAKERMEALRTSLSSESDKSISLNNSVDLDTSEAMDVDYKQIIQRAPSVQNINAPVAANNSDENLVLVVDTNIFIHKLEIIKEVLNSHIKGYKNQPTLLVPWRVINELDRLKDNNNGNGAICKWAKSAMDYLYKSLPENNRIKGQSLRDANSHIYPCELPDDEILNCCLQQSERGKSVILLSNDKNLCNKAVINSVKCIDLTELQQLLENKPKPDSNPNLHDNVKHYEDAMYQLLANILENEMRAKYNNLWQHVLFKAPPWTLEDVLQCLLKHWIAVFSEVFPRIEHLIVEMKNSVKSIQNKNPKSLSQSEVNNFKELCLDLAKKCQIIPEYMELAKLTVDRLHRTRESETAPGQDGDLVVIAAFEGLWTVLSSYCAKLASGLGISHDIEDKLHCDDPLSVLVSKYKLFADQIYDLTAALKGTLSLDGTEAGEEQLARLEAVFRDSLALVRADTPVIDRHKLRSFCTNCRNMLQEACSKFSILTELLATCRYKIPND